MRLPLHLSSPYILFISCDFDILEANENLRRDTGVSHYVYSQRACNKRAAGVNMRY